VSKPRLLDLFCGAGGCSVGYARAGFEVVGVDINPQPRYPFEFHQADALEFLKAHGREFDAIHASPPCQRYSEVTRCIPGRAQKHPDLVDPTRELLQRSGRQWVIENVPGAPLRDPLLLCGTMFGLRVIRHRLFESSVFLWSPGQQCWHPQRGKVGGTGVRGKKPGDWISVAGSPTVAVAGPAMGIAWPMSRKELANAIPPAYAEFIGKQLLSALTAAA
jgi:DNA (cytosine-5)-methyltransferase 1